MKFNRPYILSLILCWCLPGTIVLYYPTSTSIGLMVGFSLGYLVFITYNGYGNEDT